MATEKVQVKTNDGGFIAAATLFTTPTLARAYTCLLVNQSMTVNDLAVELDISTKEAVQIIEKLEDIGVVQDSDDTSVKVVYGKWKTGEETVYITPTVIATVGATEVDKDIEMYSNRHGLTSIPAAVEGTADYLRGNGTRRMIATDLGVPNVEGIIITQAIENIFAVTQNVDPHYGTDFEYDDYYELQVAESPYAVKLCRVEEREDHRPPGG